MSNLKSSVHTWGLVALISMLAVTATTFVLLFTRVKSDFARAEKKWSEELNRAKAQTTQPTPEPPKPLQPAPTWREEEQMIAGLSTTTSDALLAFTPFSADAYTDAKELSSDLVAINVKDKRGGSKIWLVNLKEQSMRMIDGASGDCDYARLESWNGGVIIEHQSSPCEAVERFHDYFLDKTGRIAAETQVGDFDRIGTEMDALIGKIKIKAKLQQATPCKDPVVDETHTWFAPTTTLTGVIVNGRAFPLPTRLQVDCLLAYGDSVDDYHFPATSFDGKHLTFRLPGYDAAISPNGTASFTARTAYVIKGRDTLVREDQSGAHIAREILSNDPIFKDHLPTTDIYPSYDFVIASFDGRIVKIKILRFNYSTQKDEDTQMTVEYDSKTDTLQNLFITPPPFYFHLEE